MEGLNELIETINENYLNLEVFDEKKLEEIMYQYVAAFGDKYLRILKKDKNMNIFDVLGIEIKILNSGMYEVINFRDDRERILKKGDIILSINNKPPLDGSFDFSEVINILAIRNPFTEAPDLVNEKYTLPQMSITQSFTFKYSENFCYAKFDNFNENIADIITLIKESFEKEIKYLIFDLRNNMGGNVRNTMKILDLFKMNTGIAFYIKGKECYDKVFSNGTIYFDKIIILINEHTMSSAELFTLSLKENTNCAIVGQKSYGKGIILAIKKLNSGNVVTIPKYYFLSPGMKNIHNIGINPDTIMIDNEIDTILRNNEYERLI